MTQVMALVWKEWRAAVDTPLGYVIAVAFLLVSGFFFGNRLFLIGQAEMREYFSIIPLLFIFFVPAMAMRMLADERRIGTFELLATFPLQTWQVVAGKYLGLLLQLGVLLAMTLIYPFSLVLLGDVDGGQIFASYLAAVLLAGAFAAVCIFASSLTSNAVVAYLIGFGLLFGFFLLSQAAMLMSPAVQQVIEIISPIQHYSSMLRGVIRLDDLLYPLCLAAVFIAATVFQLERRSWA
jgi:ABC-2 type transport system permease protein